MLEKKFIKQHRWKMTKWMKKNRHSFPDDYHFFRIFLYINYIGLLMALSGVIFMIAFLTGLFFNSFTLILWLTLFIGGLSIGITGNRMQLPFLHKFLFIYIKDQSIQVNFNVNEWIYKQKYMSVKAYKFGLLYSLIVYFPLTMLFIITVGLLLGFIPCIIIGYVLLSVLVLTNLPILFVSPSNHLYMSINEPFIFFYGLLTSISLTLVFKNQIFHIITILIIGLYWLIFKLIWRKQKFIAEDDIKEHLISDINEYLKTENEIELKYWKWIQPRRYLVKELMESGKIQNGDLLNDKIIKKN